MRKQQLSASQFDSVPGIAPLIVDCHEVARLLRKDYWSTRALILDGDLPRIQFPTTRRRRGARRYRRLLVDVRDVYRLIESCKVLERCRA